MSIIKIVGRPKDLCPGCLNGELIDGWCNNCGYEEQEGAIFDSFEDGLCGSPEK